MTESFWQRLAASVFAVPLLAAMAMAPVVVATVSDEAEARSSRSSGTSFRSYVPRSSFNGTSPGTFGRSDPTQGRIERDRLQIERFQENSRFRAREREILRQQRDVTGNRPPAPSNRLTDRLRPQVDPLRTLPSSRTNQADRQLYLQSPATDFRGDPRDTGLPSARSIKPFNFLDRNMR